MKGKIVTEKYETNIHLISLYDVLSSLQSNGKFFYPEEINADIDALLNKINYYTYHDHKGYDVLDETYYSEYTFKKN